MAQVKKPEVQQAILDAAFELFARKDYARTSIAEIARAARLSPSNIYVYFGSKLDVLWAVMEPWLLGQFDRLEQELDRIEDPEARLERLLTALWHDIPQADGNLSVNLVQGLALAEPSDRYSRDLLRRLEGRITRMLAACLPHERRHLLDAEDSAAHLAFMAFDGFVLGARVGRSDRLPRVVALTVRLLLGDERPAGAPADRAVCPLAASSSGGPAHRRAAAD